MIIFFENFKKPHKSFGGRGTFDYCVNFCKDFNSVTASIHSSAQNVASLIKREPTWLGINTINSGVLPNKWSYDNTPVDYVNFFTGFPNVDMEKTAVFLNYNDGEKFGMWQNRLPGDNSNCFCSKNSLNGAPDPPSYPQVPDFGQWCDKDWLFMDSGTVTFFLN
jgi:hypothetical protein